MSQKNIWIDINLPRPWTPWGRVSWRAPPAWRRLGSGRRGRLARAPPAATGWSWSGTSASWLPRHPLGIGEILAVSVFNWLLYKWRLCVKLTFENFLAVKNSCSQKLKWFDSWSYRTDIIWKLVELASRWSCPEDCYDVLIAQHRAHVLLVTRMSSSSDRWSADSCYNNVKPQCQWYLHIFISTLGPPLVMAFHPAVTTTTTTHQTTPSDWLNDMELWKQIKYS